MRRLLVPTMAAATLLTGLAAAAPAFAQSGTTQSLAVEPKPDPNTKPAAQLGAATTAAPAMCQADISKDARNALVALQTAVVAKDSANIPSLLAAAEAKAKTNDDRCFIAQMRVKAALDANNLAAVPAGLEAQLASGSVPKAKIAAFYDDIGQMHFQKAAYAEASSSFERALALDPARPGTVILLAETRAKQSRVAEALPLYQKAIALERSAGRVPPQLWYGRALAVSHAAKNPLAYGFAREWVTAYPSAKNWRDAIRIYADVSGNNDAMMVDLYRLQRLTRSLSGEADYGHYAQHLIDNGFAGEAKAMLDEGFAAKTVDRNTASIKMLSALAATKSAGDRAALDGQAATALANSAAKPALVLGEAYYGYGDFAKAAAMFRAALGKSGADANLVNLRLGMALAASGDKAGAKTTLAKVGGPRAEIARYWSTYTDLR